MRTVSRIWYLATLSTCSPNMSGSLQRQFLKQRIVRTYCTRWFKYDRDWFICKQAALHSSRAACLHTNQSRSYLNHLVLIVFIYPLLLYILWSVRSNFISFGALHKVSATSHLERWEVALLVQATKFGLIPNCGLNVWQTIAHFVDKRKV